MSDWILGFLFVFFMVAVGVVMCQPFFPLLDRMELDRICDGYFMEVLKSTSVDGIGLTDAQVTELTNELTDRGFTVEYTDISGSVNWGDDIHITVDVTKSYRELQGDFTYKTKVIPMQYSNESKALGI